MDLLKVEPSAEEQKAAKRSGPRNLKTLVGLGIGAGVFFGIVGFRGATLIGRLIKRDNRA